MDTQIKRQLSKMLIKRNKIVAIVCDTHPVRTVKYADLSPHPLLYWPFFHYRLIAPCHLHKNSEYCNLLVEKARAKTSVDLPVFSGSENYLFRDRRGKGLLGEGVPMEEESSTDPVDPITSRDKGEEEAALDSMSVISEDNISAHESPQSTSVPQPPFQDLSSGSSMGTGKSFGENIMTYNRLKRMNIIMEYMEESKTTSGTIDIIKVLVLIDVIGSVVSLLISC